VTPRWLVLAVCTLAHGACGGAAFTNGPDVAAVDAGGDAAAGEAPASDAGPSSLADSSAGDGDEQGRGFDTPRVDAGVDGRVCEPGFECVSGASCPPSFTPCEDPSAGGCTAGVPTCCQLCSPP
jgi:hypothetical protein